MRITLIIKPFQPSFTGVATTIPGGWSDKTKVIPNSNQLKLKLKLELSLATSNKTLSQKRLFTFTYQSDLSLLLGLSTLKIGIQKKTGKKRKD